MKEFIDVKTGGTYKLPLSTYTNHCSLGRVKQILIPIKETHRCSHVRIWMQPASLQKFKFKDLRLSIHLQVRRQPWTPLKGDDEISETCLNNFFPKLLEFTAPDGWQDTLTNIYHCRYAQLRWITTMQGWTTDEPGVQFWTGESDISLPDSVQAGSGEGGVCLVVKLTVHLHLCRDQECVELYSILPYVPMACLVN